LVGWACTAPSEALKRYCELVELRQVSMPRPILEIGCGNGRFTALAVGHVERGVDVDARSVARARELDGVYDRVDEADIRTMVVEPGAYGTVFANSLLMMLDDPDPVLDLAARALRPGGALVATVQLPTLYEHLVSRSPRYVRWRYRSLGVATSWTEEEWRAHLGRAGFERITLRGYMPASLSRVWDAIDGPATIGWGRYRMGIGMRVATGLLPRRARHWYHRRWATVLRSAYERHRHDGAPTDVLIVAHH
ncbi:MAG: class I SAM-dependent DNA methyltransferase, partial [Actinomycetes bacterium]